MSGTELQAEFLLPDRRTQEQWMSGGSAINTFSYSFDAASQLTSASATGTQMTYTFDNLGRVLTPV